MAHSDDAETTIVLDNGSGVCMIGFAGDDAPQDCFQSYVGRPLSCKSDRLDYYVGDAAQSKRDVLRLQHPIEHGIVTNWDNMEKVWEYAYKSIDTEADKHRVLLSEAPLNPKCNKEHMAQTFFETFNAPAMYVEKSSTLSRFAFGSDPGTIIELGDGVVDVAAFSSSSFPFMEEAVRRQDFAGRDLTHYLQKLLNEKGYSFSSTTDMDILREIKEEACQVALSSDIVTVRDDSRSRSPSDLKYTHVFPDGSQVVLEDECFRCAEALFQPSLCGRDDLLGLPHLIYDAMMTCDVSLRAQVFGQIILSGGSSQIPGLPARLQNELNKLFPFRCKVISKSHRGYGTWIGGSILASLSTSQPYWVTKAMYDEHGLSVLHKRTFL